MGSRPEPVTIVQGGIFGGRALTAVDGPLGSARRLIKPETLSERGSMKVLVAVKRVIDYNVKVRVKADGRASNSRTSKCR